MADISSYRDRERSIVEVGPNVRLFFSYRTLIGAEVYTGGGTGSFRYRVRNYWGPTTGRHFREHGIDAWPVYDGDDFAADVLRRIREAI